MILNNIVFIALFSLLLAGGPQPTAAQGSDFSTPQYSGQTPQFDRGMDHYRDHGNARRAAEQRLQAIQRDRHNDLAVDRQNAVRSLRIQDEMARKREESRRAAERHQLLHLND